MTRIKDYDSSTAKENFLDASAEDAFVFPASFAQERLWFLEKQMRLLPKHQGKSAI